MKNVANYISLSRILLSILLLFTQTLSSTFFIIYVLCGISDFLDGYVARKMSSDNEFGAKIDSIADIVFFLVYLIVLLPILRLSNYIIVWIMVIFLIRLTSIILGYKKFGKFSSIHTNLNKLTGISLFFFPFSLPLTISQILLVIIVIICTLASLEELIIIYYSENLDSNSKGILHI